MKRIFLLILIFIVCNSAEAQISDLERIEPPNWWAGMKKKELQLVVYGKGIASREVKIAYPEVKLLKVHKVENPNYLFLDLEIAPNAQPGAFDIDFLIRGKKKLSYKYELKERDDPNGRFQGVTTKDLIYLIMPDRFANGDYSNDIVKGMKEAALNRDSMYYRHGGDLKGIINKLDYLEDLGVTALWLNPVLENDQPLTSYHGYANTENYKIDRRYGNNELYRQLVEECHTRGMKVIKDIVHNHIGSEHWTVKDLPFKDWVHQWPEFTRTSYKDQVLFDPYAAEADKKVMLKGWFDYHMPDVNQDSPFVRNYFTQSHIWWIEYAGLDGFRLDTYAYNNLDYMAEWAKDINEEFPNFTFFGETWVHGVPNQAFFTKGNKINQGFDTGLQGVTDFQAYWGIIEAMNGKFGWTDGVNKLYTAIASDFVYEDPTRNVVFLDNHDISRFYSVVGEDIDKYKSALAWLLTTRGIPQLYYGAEILMKNLSDPDGKVREDFKGGWKEDKEDKFTAEGRTPEENEIFDFVKKLANYRKNNEVFHTGKLTQFVPENGVYVYFRHNSDKTIMVAMNTNEKEESIAGKRFNESLGGFKTGVNVITGEICGSLENITIPGHTTLVMELMK